MVDERDTPLSLPRRMASGPIPPIEALGLKPDQLEEYAAASALFSGVLNSTADGILVVDRDARIVTWNRMFLDMWHISHEVMSTRDDSAALDFVLNLLVDPRGFLDRVRQLYATPEAESFDVLELKDGRVFERFSRPLRLRGEQNGRVWSFRDATVRISAERSLRESEEKFRAFAEGAACGLVVYRGNEVVFANRWARVFAGADVRGRNFWDAVHPEDREAVRERGLARQRGEPVSPRFEVRMISGRGETRWFEITAQPITFESLPGALATAYDVTERKEAEERTRYVAFHDALTDLPNRALFFDRAEAAMSLARRESVPLGIVFLDLDRFKNVNDSLGHAAGDELIRGVGARLRSLFRESDTVARLGGDEFALLLPGMALDDAPRMAKKILDAFRAPFPAGGRDLHVTPSLGLALFPSDGGDVHTLLKNADIAMYRAKETGRDRYQLFDSRMNETAHRALELENQLYLAIANDEFEVHYQPLLRVATERIEAFEALVRWRRPGHGLVEPSDFIPIAETTGLIQSIGTIVLRRACFDAMRLRAAAGRDVRIAVNIAAGQLREASFVDLVADLMREASLPPAGLELEVTESSALQDQERTLEILHSLVALGLSLSLDDFGTGYASLDLLRRMPVKRIKIDRSFVRDIENDPVDAAIASATVALAHKLGLEVVGEGVETPIQREFLESHQCDLLQGFLISRPVPIEQALSLLAENA